MDKNPSLETVLAHGRAALYFHAGERSRMFRLFLIILSAAITGCFYFGSRGQPTAALVIALLLALLTVLFKLLDYRSRKLVHHAEQALEPAEARLAEASGLPEITLTARSRENRNQSHTILYQASYTITLMLALFLAIFAYAARAG